MTSSPADPRGTTPPDLPGSGGRATPPDLPTRVSRTAPPPRPEPPRPQGPPVPARPVDPGAPGPATATSTSTRSASDDGSAAHLALEKHECPACGARAEWNPGQQALVCPYCGTVSPYEIDDSGTVHEIGLVSTLRDLPAELRGWQAPTRTVRCQSCNAVSVFEAGRVAQNCEFCGSPELVDYEEIKSPIRPQGVVPFRIEAMTAKDTIKKWFGSKWLAPNSFKKAAFLDTLQGVYIPYWTFDAHVECPWQADSGTYYYVTEQVRDSSGKTVSRQVQKVRWTPASGHVSHDFDDEPIPGTQGAETNLLRAIEPFPTQDSVPYDRGYLSGFVVEHYRVVLIEAAKQGREAMDRSLHGICGAAVPGDTYRNLRIHPTYSGETFKHVLVPVWMLTYRFRNQPYQVLINGHSGRIAGRYPKSAWKVFFLVLGIAIVVVLFLMMQSS